MTMVERIEFSDADSFLRDYIMKRKPCVISSGLDDMLDIDKNKPLASMMDIKEFRKSLVKVEKRSERTASFGTADHKKEQMTVEQLVELLRSDKGSDYYLTTQYKETDAEDVEDHRGVADILPSPIHSLLDIIPIRPKALCALVPQQLNLWMGRSEEGSSSGLHHDYHDNLYCLLQGKKRFTLFPPQEAPKLYTYGEIQQIHDNGLIVYKQGGEERELVRSDGAIVADVAFWKSEKINRQLEEARKAGAKKRVKLLQDEYEKAVETYLDLAQDDGELIDEEEVEEWVDDDENSVDMFPEASECSDDVDWSAQDDFDDLDDIQDNPSEEPPSFSRIPVPVVHGFMQSKTFDGYQGLASIPEEFKLLSETAPLSVELKKGEFLYLPASWFHEVTSYSESDADPMHLALNYWFHPPACIDGKLYEDEFWETRFQEQLHSAKESDDDFEILRRKSR